MDKNENGYPITGRTPGTLNGRSGMGNGGMAASPGERIPMSEMGEGCPGTGNGRMGVNPDARNPAIGNGGCAGTSCVDSYPLAYVYAPNQAFRLLYSAEEALKHGTLFEELYKPKEVYGRE